MDKYAKAPNSSRWQVFKHEYVTIYSRISTSFTESGSSLFFVSGSMSVTAPPIAALTVKKMFGKLGLIVV